MNNKSDRGVWMITGAAGALGSAMVRRLAANGHDCVALDSNARALNKLHDAMEADGLPAPALMPMDLTGAGPEDYARLAEALEQEFGTLDVLIHAAAMFVALRPLLHQPADEWFRTLQTGLTGPFLLTSALAPLLSSSPAGKVVFINDRHCLGKPANWGAYGVAQAGREQMVAALSEEAGRHGTRFQAIDPGPFFSGLRTAAWPSESPGDLPSPETAADGVLAQINQ
jgi:NAD(P)-dependent dehydrogenase (short-subunit alcohol dehydrogenase family)